MDPRKKPPKLSWGRSFGKRRCFSTFWKCRKNNFKKEPEKDARETESISPAQSKFTPRFSRSSIFIFRRECWEKTSSSFPADLQGGDGWRPLNGSRSPQCSRTLEEGGTAENARLNYAIKISVPFLGANTVKTRKMWGWPASTSV